MKIKLLISVVTVLSLSLEAHAILDLFGGSKNKSKDSWERISSLKLKGSDVDRLEIITDNDLAFENKIALIKKAKDLPVGQRTIDLIYYIYDSDVSTSVMNQELIKAAQAGVKVRLLVDLFANFANQQTLEMLVDQGAGNIEVSYFGRPTRNIVLDAVYSTTACSPENRTNTQDPKACSREKLQKVDEIFTVENPTDITSNISTRLLQQDPRTAHAAMYLAGLYAKNPKLIQGAIINGQQINPADLQSSDTEMTAEDKADLLELLSLIVDSKIKTGLEGVQARLKLYMAFQLYGEKVSPIYNLISSIAGLDVESSSAYQKTIDQRGDDWSYLTDFTHHKLLLVGGQYVHMGGRNIQDSYHTQMNDLSAKYTFMDTDIAFDLKSSNSTLTQTFEKLWNFTPFVGTMDEVNKVVPFELVAQLGGKGSLSERIANQKEIMNFNADVYKTTYLANRKAAEPSIALSDSDKATADIYYLENLVFDKDSDEKKRIYGSRDGNESDHGRYIHEAWIQGMEDVCETSKKQKKDQHIFIHNAYFAPPSNLLEAFGKMVDGTWDCGRVKVSILTNSFHTTDLAVVNSFGIYALKAFTEYYEDRKTSRNCESRKKCAEFQYYEYQPASNDPTKLYSLHTKVTVLGDSNIIVGSANADYRSYMRDTNNALLVRNAPQLVAEYTAQMEAILNDPQRVSNITAFFTNASLSDIGDINDQLIDSQLTKYGVIDKMVAKEMVKLGLDPTKEDEATLQAKAQVKVAVEAGIEGQQARIREILEKTAYEFSKASVDNLIDEIENGSRSRGQRRSMGGSNHDPRIRHLQEEKKRQMNLLDELFKFI